MLNKDREAHKAASEEYWKHWDNKTADVETMEIREVRCLKTLTEMPLFPDPQLGAQSRIRNPYETLL